MVITMGYTGKKNNRIEGADFFFFSKHTPSSHLQDHHRFNFVEENLRYSSSLSQSSSLLF